MVACAQRKGKQASNKRVEDANANALLPFEAQPEQKLSLIDQDFEDLFSLIDRGDSARARECLENLRGRLQSISSVASRPKGGCQYSPLSILDCVLLADNLRPLSHETDLLPEVVRQSGAQIQTQTFEV